MCSAAKAGSEGPAAGLADGAAPVRVPVSDTAWRALRWFTLYRLVIAGVLAVLVATGSLPAPMGHFEPRLFAAAAGAYLLAAIAALALVESRRVDYRLQVFGQVLLDIAVLTLMMYASGGVTSGFGMLMVVAVAGASLLHPGRAAMFYAALATLAVLGEELYAQLTYYVPLASYLRAGVLGATFFATALVGYLLGERARRSEADAARHARTAASLGELNEHIVQRMQSGVVVVDPREGRLRLANASARQLLGLPAEARGQPLRAVAPELEQRLRSWLQAGTAPLAPFRCAASGLEVVPAFARLGGDDGPVLGFLDDAAQLRQRAQQLKLASLGRLTGSIAHEVRNPLAAIRHATQLLGESLPPEPAAQRLLEIVRTHCDRVNATVESVLALGRREPPRPQAIPLAPWLDTLAAELAAQHRLRAGDLEHVVEPRDLAVRMDPQHLRQVLGNLVDNALRYATVAPRVRLRAGIAAPSGRPFIEVTDSGPGIGAAVREQVFDPFFTTEGGGTGLGLYLAAEMCEANQASLMLVDGPGPGATFRILFAPPERRQQVA